jgi:diketogulonate reductase-like aldo/keto reductase
MKTITLPSGRSVPALGQGTWKMGEIPSLRKEEIAALQLGIDLGMTLIDTAEMYGDGESEELIREAIGHRRDEAFIVSKVYPFNASRRGVVEACEQSLQRLGTDRIDLYLLHWPGSVPLDETFEAFQALKAAGKILDYGVSNFDTRGMQRCVAAKGGGELATNQILYNLARRGVEWDLLPWQRQHGMPVMAYSPIEHSPNEQFGFLDDPTLEAVAHRYDATPAQVAIAWLLHQQDVIVIPKAGRPEHVRENRKAADLELNSQDFAELDEAFPPPSGPTPLDIR